MHFSMGILENKQHAVYFVRRKVPKGLQEAVAKVLANGQPRTTKDITARAAKIATGLKGKTPEASLSAFLYTEAKKPGGT